MAIHHFTESPAVAATLAEQGITGEWVTRNGVHCFEWITFASVCLFPQQRSSIMDSYYTDFGMLVYDPSRDAFVTEWYTSDRDESPIHSYAEVDASPETLALYQARQEEQARKTRERAELIRVMTPEKGKRLEVIKGRKVARGTIGECIWVGHSNYGDRVGLRDDAGQVHWTAITNVQVI